MNGDGKILKPIHEAALLVAMNILAIALFSSAFSINFVQDDWYFFRKAMEKSVDGRFDLSSAVTKSFAIDKTNFYKPINDIYYAFAFHAFGMKPFRWHLVAMCMFVAVNVLFFVAMRGLGVSPPARMIACLMFMTSFVNFRILNWISLFHDLAVAVFLLIAFIMWIRFRAKPSLARAAPVIMFYVCAMWSKEHGSLLPLPLAAVELVMPPKPDDAGSRKKAWALIAVMLAMMVPYMLFQIAHTQAEEFQFKGQSLSVGWHIFPNFGRQASWAAANDTGLAMMLIVFAALGCMAAARDKTSEIARSQTRAVVMGILWFGAFIGVFLLMPRHEYEYHLYVPRMGFSMCLGVGLWTCVEKFSRDKQRYLVYAAVMALIGLSLKDNVKKIGRMKRGKETVVWMSRITTQNLEEGRKLFAESPDTRSISIVCPVDDDIYSSCLVLQAIQQSGDMFAIYFSKPGFKARYNPKPEEIGDEPVYDYKDGAMTRRR